MLLTWHVVYVLGALLRLAGFQASEELSRTKQLLPNRLSLTPKVGQTLSRSAISSSTLRIGLDHPYLETIALFFPKG